jgi:hypothetical protein
MENFVTADISRMKDHVNSSERVVHAGSDQSVSVGYQSNGVTVRSGGHGLYISR